MDLDTIVRYLWGFFQEKEMNEKLRIQLKQLGARNEMVTRDFQESKNKLEIEAAKNLSSSVDQKGRN